MGVVRAENSDYSKNHGKNTKKTINSSKIHTPLAQASRVGLDGDVHGVNGKTPLAQEEATKVRPKIYNTSNLQI